MQTGLRDDLKRTRAELRDFLESLHAPDQPGHFRARAGEDAAAESAQSLGPSCLALRVARTLGLWRGVDAEDREAWLAYVRGFQTDTALGGEPLTAGAFLDPVVVARRHDARGWTDRLRGRSGLARTDGLAELALSSTRAAVSALLAVDATPARPYRAVPHRARELEKTLRRVSWREPVRAAAVTGDLIALVVSQGPHFLELTEIRALREVCSGHLDTLARSESGGYHRGPAPRHADLVGAAARMLEALVWLDEPPHHPERLLDTCLARRPSLDGRGTAVDDWARVLHHCASHSTYRRSDVRDAALETLEAVLEQREKGSGWLERPGGGHREPPDGARPAPPEADLHGTARFCDAAALLARLLDEGIRGWTPLRA